LTKGKQAITYLVIGDVRGSTEVRQVELTDAALHIIATRGIAALPTRRVAGSRLGLSSVAR